MRLIDADALIGALHNCAFLEGDDRSICYNIIQRQSTIDAVPVIRCIECKHSDAYNHCTRLSIWNKPEDFCSYGEREEDG